MIVETKLPININIRKADERDFPFIFALMKEFSIFQKTPEKFTLTLEQLIAEKDIFQCLVAETDNSEIIGFGSFSFLPITHGQAKVFTSRFICE